VTETCILDVIDSQPPPWGPSFLERLPKEVVENILQLCDAKTLGSMQQTCKAFRTNRLVEKISKSLVLAAAGENAGRWR
jgi:hypothetical protein